MVSVSKELFRLRSGAGWGIIGHCDRANVIISADSAQAFRAIHFTPVGDADHDERSSKPTGIGVGGHGIGGCWVADDGVSGRRGRGKRQDRLVGVDGSIEWGNDRVEWGADADVRPSFGRGDGERDGGRCARLDSDLDCEDLSSGPVPLLITWSNEGSATVGLTVVGPDNGAG